MGTTCVSLLLYVFTLQPGLLGGDSAEAQFVPFVLGIFHYTGYPLYALVGYLWINLLPVGTVAYRMNLLSGVTSALAVGGTAWLGRRLSGAWLGGLIAASMLACSGLFWEWATRAGVRSLNATFVVAIFALAVLWSDTPKQERRSGWRWILLWVVVGLSQAHHRTTLLMLPLLCVYLVWTDPALLRDWRAWLWAGLAMLPGILFYLYLPIRSAANPPYAFQQVDSLNHFLDLVLARGQNELIGAVPLPAVMERLGRLGTFLTAQFTLPGVLLGVGGIVWLFKSQRREATFLGLCALLITGFTLTYDNEDLSLFYLIPVNIVMALGIGVGLVQIARLGSYTASRVNFRHRGLVGSLLGLAPALCLVAQIVPQGLALHPTVQAPLDAYRSELRQQQAARLTHPPLPSPPRAMIIGEWEHMAAFWYSQLVDGAWQGAEFHYPVDEGLPALISRGWAQGRSVYITEAVPELGKHYQLSMQGPLISVLQRTPRTLSANAVSLEKNLEGGITFAGYEPLQAPFQPGQVLPLTIYWQARKGITKDYSISVRLLRQDGTVAAQADNENPVLGSYPTSEWRFGAVIGDYYELPLDSQLAPGTYWLAVVVYWRESDGTFHNLPIRGTSDTLNRFAQVQLASSGK